MENKRFSLARRCIRLFRAELLRVLTCVRFYFMRSWKPHGLPGTLVLSLTSYPPRFATLLPTLRCLLTQSMRPDKVILWVSKDDIVCLPDAILALQRSGLEIRGTAELRSYKKIVPALINLPDAFIVTADDDIWYPRKWLEKLISAWDGDSKVIVCHRAHRIGFDEHGCVMPYLRWRAEHTSHKADRYLFPTGVGGILYPPHCLSSEASDDNLFMKLAPQADDVWLYWMGRRNGAIYKKTPYHFKLISWNGSQENSLMQENVGNYGNDRTIRAMVEYFGWPD